MTGSSPTGRDGVHLEARALQRALDDVERDRVDVDVGISAMRSSSVTVISPR